MESFAEYLKGYLSKQNLTFSQAAKETGIERTILNRFANGSRIPQNIEVVLKLAKGLQMTVAEEKEFTDAYKRLKIGEEFGVEDTTLTAIVGCSNDSIDKGEEQQIYSDKLNVEESAKHLEGEDEIIEAVRYILHGAKFAKIHFTPKDFLEEERFKRAFGEMEDIRQWEQILCLEHREWKYGEERMRNLLHFLPYLFSCEKACTYYHYRRGTIQSGQNIKYQYLLTDKGIVFFDKELETGFYSNQQVPCEFYAVAFDEEKKKCRVFAEGGKEQFLAAKIWKPDMIYENKITGITFWGQKEAADIWMINQKEQAVCVRERGAAQVLWKYIRNQDR